MGKLPAPDCPATGPWDSVPYSGSELLSRAEVVPTVIEQGSRWPETERKQDAARSTRNLPELW